MNNLSSFYETVSACLKEKIIFDIKPYNVRLLDINLF